MGVPAGIYDPESLRPTIDVDTAEMAVCGMLAIPISITQVADQIKKVGDIGSSLNIGWVGTTAQEAQDFIDRWQKTMTTLFGRSDADPNTPPAPGEDILGRIAAAVTGAAVNFAWANKSVTDVFNGFTAPATSTGQIQPARPTLGSQPDSDIVQWGIGSGVIPPPGGGPPIHKPGT
jgi:hypothetical protein